MRTSTSKVLAAAAAAVLSMSTDLALGQLAPPPGPPPGPAPAPAPQAVQPAPATPPQAAVPAAPRPAPAAPSGLSPTVLGPLEITPQRAVLRNSSTGSVHCIVPTLRFRLKNTGPADVRVAVIASSINVVDDLGLTVLGKDPRGIAIPAVTGVSTVKDTTEWNRAAGSAGSQITTLGPGQTISIQFAEAARRQGTHHCVNDPTGNFIRSYRPTSVTISATLATLDLTGSADLRPFSMFDVPADLLRL